MDRTDPPPDGLRDQWPEALAMARRACGHTLARLRRGEGGFYQAQDFEQDLYCAWAALCDHHGRDQESLWRAWSGLLYAGGRQLLRRPPQRLWRRPDLCLPLQVLEGMASAAPAHDSAGDLLWGRMAGALWQMPLAQRQIIYLRTLDELSARQVGLSLGLSPASVDARLRRARARLVRDIHKIKEHHP